ncbi:transposase [Deinococcus hohokamensis]|uniref:Transposase n=1 Tax=Deinococcus hohokamensis TaxID=309883 RepID=A0ABV9I6G4_9DEIO
MMDGQTPAKHTRKCSRAGYDAAKKRKGNKVHLAVDTLGHVLDILTTSAYGQDKAQFFNLGLEV